MALRTDGVAHGKELTAWEDLWPLSEAVPTLRARELHLPVHPPADAPEEPRGVSSETWQRLSDRGLDTNVNAILAETPWLLRGDAEAGTPAWVSIDLRHVTVDGAFLVDAIRFYAGNPDARSEIGTKAGYARLLSSR